MPDHNNQSERSALFSFGITVGFAVLAFFGTKVISIPIPGTGGYFNLGDTFVMIAALLFGPVIGAIVGATGPALADAIGYLPYAPATFVIKGLEGLLIGVIARNATNLRVIIALAVATLVIAGGYFIVQGFIYVHLGKTIPFFNITTFNAAVAEFPLNLLQGGLSALVAFGVWRAFRGMRPSN